MMKVSFLLLEDKSSFVIPVRKPGRMLQCRSGICVDWYNARTLDNGIRYYRVSGHGSVLIMEVLVGIEFGRN